MTDVHTEHCCRFHGCKYGKDSECTVVAKGELQSYPCENCDEEQGRQIQEDRHPRCGALPRDPTDDSPCFLRKGHLTPIHRSKTGMFTRTRPEPLNPPDDSEPSATAIPLSAFNPQARVVSNVQRQDAMLTLQGAIEKAEGLGRGRAWDALHLIQAVLNEQDANIKRIQLAYLDLVEQRLAPVANRASALILRNMREELKK